MPATPERRPKFRGKPARPRRVGKAPRQRRPLPAIAVELTISVDDGWEKDAKKVRLAGPSAPRRGAHAAAQVRTRQAAAKRVGGGCRPRSLARLLAAVAHAQRLAILRELLAGEATHKTLARLTKLKAGPLYYHVRELRAAGLIGPKVRDLYVLTRRGRRLLLGLLAIERLAR